MGTATATRNAVNRRQADRNAQTAFMVGEFNDWNVEANPMTRGEHGSFSVAIALKVGHSYRFRYLLDDARWENDLAADAYVPNPYGSDGSVVHCEAMVLTRAPHMSGREPS